MSNKKLTESMLNAYNNQLIESQPPAEPGPPPYSALAVGRGRWLPQDTIYHSQSSLELDSSELVGSSDSALGGSINGTLARSYGSTSSLDALSASADGFFALLEGYRADQRPSLVPDVVKSPQARAESQEPEQPRRKSRLRSTPDSLNILKKLRGSKHTPVTSPAPADDVSSLGSRTDYGRGRIISYYDCQALVFSLSTLARGRLINMRRRNVTTGASAAALARSGPESDQAGSPDPGDDNTNSLLLSCPYFRNELGGDPLREVAVTRAVTALRREGRLPARPSPTALRTPYSCAVSVIDPSPCGPATSDATALSQGGYFIEHVDHGACYYRKFFVGFDHQNYFGLDDRYGPIAVSIRREKLSASLKIESGNSSLNSSQSKAGLQMVKESTVHCYQYRVIIRTSELITLRCSVREDAVPCSSRPTPSKGLPHRDLIEYLAPELQQSALRLATVGKKTHEQLLKVDESGLSKCYKVGVLLCRENQGTEEEMYCNEATSPAFDEFLSLLGQRVRLKGFPHYRAQLDNRTDSSGTHSVYTTFCGAEVMFHVSTLLPYTAHNKQQLLRKRHIGNDIVTIVFQEPGSKPFTPRVIRSHFQHVFIVVRVQNPNTDNVTYSVAVSRSRDVPPFGPPVPESASFEKSADFTNFLLAKVINAENAVHKSEKFVAMATRTRQEYLKDLATHYITSTTLDSNSRLGRFGFGSVRKRDRHRKVPSASKILVKGGCVWHVEVDEQGRGTSFLDCWLVVSSSMVVAIDKSSKEVLFVCSCDQVLGWARFELSMRLYYGFGEMLIVHADPDDLPDIEHRLQQVTTGCPAIHEELVRDSQGLLGLHVTTGGQVQRVERGSAAARLGLTPGSRLVEADRQLVLGLTPQGIKEAISSSDKVPVVVLPASNDTRTNKPSLLPLCTTGSGEEEVFGPAAAAGSHRASVPRDAIPRVRQSPMRASTSQLCDGRASSLQASRVGTPMSSLESRGCRTPVSPVTGGMPWRSRAFSPSSSRDQCVSPLGAGFIPITTRIPMHDRVDRDTLNQSCSSRDGLNQSSRDTLNQSSTLNHSSRDTLNQSGCSSRDGLNSSGRFEPAGRGSVDQQLNDTMSSIPSTVSQMSSIPSTVSQISATRRSTTAGLEGVGQPRQTRANEIRTTSAALRASRNRSSSTSSVPLKCQKPSQNGVSVLDSSLTRSVTTELDCSFQDDLRKLIDLELPESAIRPAATSDSQSSLSTVSAPLVAEQDLMQTSTDSPSTHRSQTPSQQPNQHTPITSAATNGSNGPVINPKPIPKQRSEPKRLSSANCHLVSDVNGHVANAGSVPNGHESERADSTNGWFLDSDEDKESEWQLLVDAACKSNSPTSASCMQSRTVHNSMPRDLTTRVHDLQGHIKQLETQLHGEQRLRSTAEAEVSSLRHENKRLHEESQTAAAQLRKFTHWFFSNMDRSELPVAD